MKENLSIEEENEKLWKVFRHLAAEHTGAFFICGEGRDKDDEHYLPKRIEVCPAYGADFRTTVTYERKD